MSRKMKCYLCGKNEQIVGEKTIKLFCTECLMNGKYQKYKMQQQEEKRLEELKK